MKIYLLGLGIKEDDISLKALQILQSGKKIIVKTALTNSYKNVRNLKIKHTLLDFVFEKSRNLDTLNKNLANEVLSAAKTEDIVYCVDGNAACDNSCKIILKRHKDCEIISAPSKADYFMQIANFEPNSYYAVSAYDIKDNILKLPLIVYDIDNEYLAGDIKLILSDYLGEEEDILYIDTNVKQKIKLFELDRQESYGYLTAIAVESKPLLKKNRFDYNDLTEIVKRLRMPGGCPWDRAQTHDSIRMNMIEEAYELVDAINLKDDDKMLEETGDVLLQAVFHSVMAEERGVFNTTDVLSAICSKLIFRHTHIFGSDKACDAKEALNFWEKNKVIEKGHKTYGETLKDVPKNFPSLMYAEKLQKRAAKSGFDFADYKDAIKKITEEFNELNEAINQNDTENIKKEGGDLLFAVCNVLRLLKTDSEDALKLSCNKFMSRFVKMEDMIIKDGKNIKELSPCEMDGYYNEVKKTENQ